MQERRDHDPSEQRDGAEEAEPDDRVEAPERGQADVADEVRLPEPVEASVDAPAKNAIADDEQQEPAAARMKRPPSPAVASQSRQRRPPLRRAAAARSRLGHHEMQARPPRA